MSRYLVTGAAGFIGSSLVRALLVRGDEVRGVDNFSTGKPENLAEVRSQMDFREADILDLEAMRHAGPIRITEKLISHVPAHLKAGYSCGADSGSPNGIR